MQPTDLFLLDPDNRAFLTDQPPRGRAIRWARLGLLLTLAVLAVCLFLTGWAAVEWGRWLLLQRDYSVVGAEVVKCRKDERGDGGPEYYVTYRFEAATPTGPVVYQREQNVGRATYARVHPGQVVNVRYNNAIPAISAIVEDTNFRDGISVGALMWLPVTLFMGYQVKRCRREIRLSRRGRLLEGRVVECTATPAGEDGYKLELRYRFTAPGGRIIRDREIGYREELRDDSLPVPDTPVAILYLDEKNYKVL